MRDQVEVQQITEQSVASCICHFVLNRYGKMKPTPRADWLSPEYLTTWAAALTKSARDRLVRPPHPPTHPPTLPARHPRADQHSKRAFWRSRHCRRPPRCFVRLVAGDGVPR
nr:unnamed protein product [Digitaria exilis]